MMTLLPGRAANKVLAEADGMPAQGGDSGPTAPLPAAPVHFSAKFLKRGCWSACVFLEINGCLSQAAKIGIIKVVSRRVPGEYL